ncbi:MAG: radical SAM protein [Candidatus Omnitrophota bacterium]
MKVALVFPPVYGVDFPHLGLAYIAAKIREEKHDVKIFCFNSKLYAESGDARHLWDWFNADLWLKSDEIKKHFDIEKVTEGWLQEIMAYNPEVVGFSVNTHSKMMANLLATKIKKKKKDIKIIFGGPYCSEGLGPLNCLNTDVDIFVKGEGEDIISSVLNRLAGAEPLSGIEGTITQEQGVFKDNGENKGIAQIDRIPFPAFDLFNMDYYDNKTQTPILFSRGCNYGCRFCCDKPIWGRYRMREAENIVAEIKKHKNQHGRSGFTNNDLLVNGDLKALERLADLLIQEKLDITWGGMARARKDMPETLLKKMKAAGCLYLTFGIESGSNKILKFMGKPSAQEAAITIKRAHEAGIRVNTLWMVGHPKETTLDLLKTMWFLFKNRKNIEEFVNVSPCYIPHNSLLHQQAGSLQIEYDRRNDWYIKSERNFYKTRIGRAKALRFLAKLLGI